MYETKLLFILFLIKKSTFTMYLGKREARITDFYIHNIKKWLKMKS